MELALIILNCALTVVVLIFLLRRPAEQASAQEAQDQALELQRQQQEQEQRHRQQMESLAAFETRLRDELRRSEQGVAGEVKAIREALGKDTAALRTELDGKLAAQLRNTLDRLEAIRQTLDGQLMQTREAMQAQLTRLNADNQKKLDEMRGVVDEKLQATLQTRLGEAFKQVSERLEQLHKGLGEMQTIAAEVGGLKRVLSNVKARGILGEVQLDTILADFLAPDQIVRNAETSPRSGKRVEFAVRMPGRGETPVLLPIDAKFPKEDYERLLDAYERADREGADAAARALAASLRQFAKDIRTKYVDPPHTTEFALLFLPTEGLYAEVLRQQGLVDQLRQEHRVIVAGPTTLAALLQSLQMGFRTLALEKRSSEVWALLGAVKTEFARYADVIEKAKKQLDSAANSLEDTGKRTRAIERKLRDVQELPQDQAALLLPAEGEAAAKDDHGN